MKEVVTSFNTVMLERIKNPLIGTFVLSWVAWNHKGIGAFLLGDDKAKQAIVKQFNFLDWWELVAVIGTAVGYIALTQFALPWVQNLIDIAKLKWVDEYRFKQRSRLSQANSKHETKANIRKHKSQPEYIAKVAEEQLLNWTAKVVKAKEECLNEKAKVDKLLKNLAESENENTSNIENSKIKYDELVYQHNQTIEAHELQLSSALEKHQKAINEQVKLHTTEISDFNTRIESYENNMKSYNTMKSGYITLIKEVLSGDISDSTIERCKILNNQYGEDRAILDELSMSNPMLDAFNAAKGK